MGLIRLVLHRRQCIEELIRRDLPTLIPDLQDVAEGLGIHAFIEAVGLEAHRVGFIRPGHGGDKAGIHTAGQEGTNLHISDKMILHGVLHLLEDPLCSFLFCHVLGSEGCVEILLRLHPFPVIREVGTWLQLVDVAEQSLLHGRILEDQIHLQGFPVHFLPECRMRQE